MWPAAQGKKEGGDFRFFSTKIKGKTSKVLGPYKL
jgi:hypothetical protein